MSVQSDGWRKSPRSQGAILKLTQKVFRQVKYTGF